MLYSLYRFLKGKKTQMSCLIDKIMRGMQILLMI